MPNHVTTRFMLMGPADEVARFKAAHLKPAKDPDPPVGWFLTRRDQLPEVDSIEFDFDTIVPRPEIYDSISSGSSVDNAVEAISGKPIWEFKPRLETMLKSFRNIPPVGGVSVEERERLRQERQDRLTPEELAEGARALEAYEKYGYLDWYEWCIGNWGTKWGAYHLYLVQDDPGHLEFKFDTAWSPPTPIFEKLAEMYPALQFVTISFDEGWGFAVGGHARAGTYTEYELETNDDTYEAVYGYRPDREDEDEDEEEGDEVDNGAGDP